MTQSPFPAEEVETGLKLTAEEVRLIRSRRARKAAAEKTRADREARVAHESARPDRGRERDPGFLAYLRRQPCEARELGNCSGSIEAAHIRYSDAAKGSRNPGMQRKNHDRHATPLCRFHHQHDQHTRSERAFWAALGKDAYDTAAKHYAAYKARVSLEKSTDLCEK